MRRVLLKLESTKIHQWDCVVCCCYRNWTLYISYWLSVPTACGRCCYLCWICASCLTGWGPHPLYCVDSYLTRKCMWVASKGYQLVSIDRWIWHCLIIDCLYSLVRWCLSNGLCWWWGLMPPLVREYASITACIGAQSLARCPWNPTSRSIMHCV